MTTQLNAEMKRAADELASRCDELKAQRQEELGKAEARFAAARSAATSRHNSDIKDLEERFAQHVADIDNRYQAESESLFRRFHDSTTQRESRFHQDWEAMSARWHAGVQRFRAAVEELNEICGQLFPRWDSACRENWAPAGAIPPAVPFGRVEFALGEIEGGLPEDPGLVPPCTQFSIPALFSFRDRSLWLLKAAGEGRALAINAMQAVMLRALVSIPPGKVRFLIIDPVGLGENFSMFMHLADYHEQLVSNRIWTEPSHIERRLAELTEHMENVLQVYLRNAYATIQEYNESAGELAEPYRILVVANFPANFTEVAARRLLSIVSSGARCGVYTLMSLDTTLALPRDFPLADLERQAVRLRWNGDRFVWDDPELSGLRLLLDEPPESEQFTALVRRVGQEAKDAGRIELPFRWILPQQDEWWTADSRLGVDVPLGRAGVTKFQHLQLGRGTSQHVLIAGKTGSGKSTLLHVLIVNAALRYSPEQIQLYLVDFKKGVEFKAYAEAALPHARVIAIESEREFGLSVLERLDLELKRRGELFRQQGVQDLPAFREAQPDRCLPRILLIIDEFQELFVEDDRIAQNAALLLDRLVRQGRAFGIHVLLGSQTLGGAYSIPRSTIGQMAVRIALQCSDADAHLILSEDNTAARLLSRPGEAIYNDANGLYEGNHPFQVVWLPDAEREQYLRRLKDWAASRCNAYEPAIVFEGNLPADPSQNPLLRSLIESPSWGQTCSASKAWLGLPVAIKDPTAAVFVRQGGAHLLIVGHQEELALGIMAAALVSLAAQHAPGGPGVAEGEGVGGGARRVWQRGAEARFFVLDGTRPDSPQAGFWAQLSTAVPHQVRLAPPRQAAAVVCEIADELARREQSGQQDAARIYLFIYDLARFRDLRRAEDEFSFSRSDEDAPPNPARQFRTILRDGPAVGIHVLAWADSYNSVTRCLDRQALDDIEMRVLFRTSAADSSSLLDSPAASLLGVYRAIFADEGQGFQEKFRPYGPPSSDWLEWVKSRLHGHAAAASLPPSEGCGQAGASA